MSDNNNWEGNLIKNLIHYYVNSDNKIVDINNKIVDIKNSILEQTFLLVRIAFLICEIGISTRKKWIFYINNWFWKAAYQWWHLTSEDTITDLIVDIKNLHF